MSEDIKQYNANPAASIAAFRNRPCSLPANDQQYIPPTPDDVKMLRQLMGLSQAGLAKFLGVAYNAKGSNTVRKWETKTDNKEHRQINYASWRLMLIGAGCVDCAHVIATANDLRR